MNPDRTVGEDITGKDGEVILSHERARQDLADQNAARPPLPGMRWQISYDYWGDIASRTLHVRDDWVEVFAPPATEHSDERKRQDTLPSARDAAGRIAYQAWFEALPAVVREHGTTWDDLPEELRTPMVAAALAAWQHGENNGYSEALRRTLPSGRLGAAGELDDARDTLLGLLAAIPELERTQSGKVALGVFRELLEQVLTARARELRKIGKREAGRSR